MADLLADLRASDPSASRVADALLRTMGGRAVILRMTTPAVPGDDAEQLGLVTPQFQDVELAPASFRRNGDDSVLLVAAGAVKAVVGTFAFDSAEVLFATAAAIVIDDAHYAVTHSIAMQTQGLPFCYRLLLRRLQ